MISSLSKSSLRWLLLVAGVATVVVFVLVLTSRSDTTPRNVSSPGASAAEDSVPDEALLALSEVPPIVFASNRSGPYKLFALDASGGKPVPITDGPAMYPSWSPDGTSLAFVGETARGPDAEPPEHEHAEDAAEAGSTGRRIVLSLVEQAGNIVQLLRGPQVPSHPTVRGDGTVTYQSTLLETSEAAGVNGRSSIDTVDVGERRQRTIITNRGAAYQPAWSPDGSRLAMVLGRKGCRSAGTCRQRLVLWDPQKGTRTTIIGRGSAAAPAWSPDGTSIAFTWDRGRGPGVWVVRVGDRDLRQVTSGSPADAEPTWSPDGDSIAFMRRCDIFVQRLGGGRARNLTRSRDVCDISPAWRPSQARSAG